MTGALTCLMHGRRAGSGTAYGAGGNRSRWVRTARSVVLFWCAASGKQKRTGKNGHRLSFHFVLPFPVFWRIVQRRSDFFIQIQSAHFALKNTCSSRKGGCRICAFDLCFYCRKRRKGCRLICDQDSFFHLMQIIPSTTGSSARRKN